jgi:uncharacterized membrane protein
MSTSLFSYVIALVLFVVIDIAWLTGPGRPLYVAEIGNLLRAQPNLAAAGAFYLLYCVGLTYFGVMPGLSSAAPLVALYHGALFGLMAYATYDLTCLAVLNGFTTKIALIDMAWGSILSGSVAWAVCRVLLASGIGHN